MRLVSIDGQIWELTTLQSDNYAMSSDDKTTLEEKNNRAIQGLGWHRGSVRVLANNGVKSKATAVIETNVSGHPHQMQYEIYHNSKGFFCKVQGERVFLRALISQTQKGGA